MEQQAAIIQEAQTAIKAAVKESALKNETKAQASKRVNKIISAAVASLTSDKLKIEAKRSLLALANRVYASMPVLPSISAFSSNIYSKEYLDAVKKKIREIADYQAIDPDDVRGFNSMRNKAEMQERYERTWDKIDDMITSGVRLVVCDSHADCSTRCAPWQGRVYSLDGTSGTIDGRKFVPLEEATNVYYTTKSGTVYKNGLLGFNCRHNLTVYRKNQEIPTVSQEERKREYEITKKQRELERRVLKYKEQAVMFKDIDRKEYLTARRNAILANKQYEAFCRANDRAFYRERVRLAY